MEQDPAYIFRFPTPPDVGEPRPPARVTSEPAPGRARGAAAAGLPRARVCLPRIIPPARAGPRPTPPRLPPLPQRLPPSWASPTSTLATRVAPRCSETSTLGERLQAHAWWRPGGRAEAAERCRAAGGAGAQPRTFPALIDAALLASISPVRHRATHHAGPPRPTPAHPRPPLAGWTSPAGLPSWAPTASASPRCWASSAASCSPPGDTCSETPRYAAGGAAAASLALQPARQRRREAAAAGGPRTPRGTAAVNRVPAALPLCTLSPGHLRGCCGCRRRRRPPHCQSLNPCACPCTCPCARPCMQVRLAVFSQHHVDGLDLALSPLQVGPPPGSPAARRRRLPARQQRSWCCQRACSSGAWRRPRTA